MKTVPVTAMDIDHRHYTLADCWGYSDKSDAYNVIREREMFDCTTFFVKSKNCWAIVCPK